MTYLSARGEYGVLAMLALCLHSGQVPLQVKAIAEKGKIPVRFLEQVMNILKNKGLVESIRGPHGGYRLVKTPEQISLGDLLHAIEGPATDLAGSTRHPFSSSDERVVLDEVWSEAKAAIDGYLNSIRLSDLCERKKRIEETRALMFHI